MLRLGTLGCVGDPAERPYEAMGDSEVLVVVESSGCWRG